jgi:hypothetical protein
MFSCDARAQSQEWCCLTTVSTNGDDVLEGTPGPEVFVGLHAKDDFRGNAGDDVPG